jgi:hypothetical protein
MQGCCGLLSYCSEKVGTAMLHGSMSLNENAKQSALLD